MHSGIVTAPACVCAALSLQHPLGNRPPRLPSPPPPRPLPPPPDIYCSTQDCASWATDQRSACGGDTGVSCAQMAADGDYMFVDDAPPAPAASVHAPRTNASESNSANIGYSGSCGSGTVISTDSCLTAAELCYNNGNPLYTAAPLTSITTSNYKCRQTECQNGAIWGWNSNIQYQFQSGSSGTVSFCAGSKIWNFCC